MGKAVGIAFGLTALVAFGKQAIETASNLTEAQNVVDTAFGNMSYKMEEFAKTSIRSFGISELTAKQTGSTFMAMAKGMGIVDSASSDMAISLTGLSADMSSFYNVRQDVASTALKSIFTGETETLKQFGIVMTQANLQAFAYSKGIKQNVSDMDQATITQLRYMYVMQQTSLAQGDFAKTSGSWANQTRILSEQWKQFLGILGDGLIKILSPVLRTLNATMAYMIDFANTAGKVLSSIFGFNDANDKTVKSTNAAAESANAAADSLGKVGKAANKAGKKAKGSVADFDKLHNITESTANSSKNAASGISGLGNIGSYGTDNKSKSKSDTGIDKNMLAMIESIKKALEPASAALERLKKAFEPFAKNVGDGLKWFFDNVLVPLGKWTVSELLPAWLDNLAAVITLLNTVLEAFKPVGLWLWNNFLQPIAAWTGGLIIDALNSITNGLYSLSDWIKNNQDSFITASVAIAVFFAAFKIGTLITLLPEFIASLAGTTAAGGALGVVLSELGAAIASVFTPVLAISAILAALVYSFIDLYNNSESFRKSVEEMGNTWNKALEPLATFVGTVLADAWNKILKPIVEFFVNTLIPNLVATFENLWKNILVPLGTFLGTVLQPVFKILSDVLLMLWKNVILPLAQALGTVFKAAWDAIYQILNKTVLPIIGLLIKALTWLWKNVINPIVNVVWTVLKPVFEGVFKAIGTILKGFGSAIAAVIDFIKKIFAPNWKTLWTGVQNTIKSILSAIIGFFISANKKIGDAFAGIGKWFSNRWTDIKNVFSGVGKWFGSIFTTAWSNIKTAFSLETIKKFFTAIWSGIKGCFGGIVNWFKNEFTKAWTAVKNVFSIGGKIFDGIKDGISNVFKSVVNTLIGGINTIIAMPFKNINKMLNTIHDISILGVSPFKNLWDKNPLPIPKIPKLATGTVIPPNSEFLAMLGDQKRGVNIEAPLATIVDAFKKVQGQGSGNGDINLTINLDGKQIFSSIVNRDQEHFIQNGKSAFAH